MSRTTRIGAAEGFWATVDDWAATVVEPKRFRAWTASSCRLVGESGPYLDVTGETAETEILARLPRSLRDPIAARGRALPPDDHLQAALVRADIEHRRVEVARRYRWNGPMLTPVVLELHTTEDEGIVEAWWEDVWAVWPTIHLGRESTARRPPRRATPIAQITRLLAALGHEPLARPEA